MPYNIQNVSRFVIKRMHAQLHRNISPHLKSFDLDGTKCYNIVLIWPFTLNKTWFCLLKVYDGRNLNIEYKSLLVIDN